ALPRRLASREESLDALACLLPGADTREAAGALIDGGLERGVESTQLREQPLAVGLGLRCPETNGSEGRIDAALEGIRRHHFVYQAEPQRLGRIEARPAEEPVARGALTDRVDHVERDGRGRQSEPRLGGTEHCITASDGDITGGYQTDAA